MTVGDVAKKFALLRIRETRATRDDYEEHVIYASDIEQWTAALKDIFGPPIKPAGVAPSADNLAVCQGHGGIMKNQVLFIKELGNTILVVMFWPWMDGLHTTLKLYLVDGKIGGALPLRK